MLVPTLLRENPPFRRFWAGQAVSLVGDQVTLIALPLVAVLALDASAAEMGYLFAAELAPNLLFALHAGAWVDRRGRRRQLMIATDLVRAVLVASIPLAYTFDVLTFPHLLAVGFLMGTMSVLFQVSYGALFVSLVPRARYVEGGSVMHGTRARSSSPLSSSGASTRSSRRRSSPAEATSSPVSASSPARRSYAPHSAQPRRSLLQLRLRGALHPLRDARARRGPGHARARARRGCGRRDPRLARHGRDRPTHRDRPRVRARLRPLSGAAAARATRRRTEARRPRAPLPRRVRVNGVRPIGALAGGALGSTIGLRPTLWIATAGGLLGVLWLLGSPLPGLRTLPEAEDGAE